MEWLRRLFTVPIALWACLAVWGGYVILIKYQGIRPETPRATHDLVAGQRILPSDLETDLTKALVGYVAREKINAASRVTPALLEPPPRLEKHGNTPAIVLAMGLATRLSRRIESGSVVAVTNGDKVLGKGTVLGMDCAGDTCAMVVGLDGSPTVDAKALKGAELVLASTLPSPPPTPAPPRHPQRRRGKHRVKPHSAIPARTPQR